MEGLNIQVLYLTRGRYDVQSNMKLMRRTMSKTCSNLSKQQSDKQKQVSSVRPVRR